ncbi:TPA: hypothetical protein DCQ44_02605 [Candidatus Taylorbacteria bacterium]|nr:hypothetical protein [Candidatus Taylorbacteria bacterium]
MTFDSKFARLLATQIISEFSFMNFIPLSMVVMSMLASAHFGAADVKAMTQENPAYTIDTVTLSENIESKELVTKATVEDVVKDYFRDIPVLAKVAKCESEYRQVTESGAVLRGTQNPFDVGVMQINEKYHLDRAEKLGMNIYTLSGNLDYARALYKENGTAPWSASKPCWGNE